MNTSTSKDLQTIKITATKEEYRAMADVFLAVDWTTVRGIDADDLANLYRTLDALAGLETSYWDIVKAVKHNEVQ